VREVGG